MQKIATFSLLCLVLLVCFCGLTACQTDQKEPKIGVAMGVGAAERWTKEIHYMQEYAQEHGIALEARLNTDENVRPFKQDCMELIDRGIAVLIVRARNPFDMQDVVGYAKQKGVKIVSYAGVLRNAPVDLFVGYDCENIGSKMGEFLVENTPRGDYILLAGDPKDKNVSDLVTKGAMKHIGSMPGKIRIILRTYINDWSADEAKRLVTAAVLQNNGKVDAILAPNDKIAGACIEALAELGITNPVAVTGMDAELDAVRRIVAGTQGCTVHMDLKKIARTAMEQAVNLAKELKVVANAELDNDSGSPVLANLISGQLVTRENVDRVLIDSHCFTREDVYQP